MWTAHHRDLAPALLLLALAGSCSRAERTPEAGGGAAGGSAGAGVAGASGAPASGGAATGGSGAGLGGSANGGSANGGSANGGSANGGSANGAGAGAGPGGRGGASAGAAPSGGSAGASVAGASSGGTAGSVGGGSVFPPSVTRPRIMIVGDSISAGPGCYKKYLVENLTSGGITNHEFVGEYTDDCGGGVRHSAVSCTTTANYTQASFTVPNCFGTQSFPGMATLVATHDPDLILLQLGVNDVWGGSAPVMPILANYATLISQARAHNPNVVVMVAQIHKIITDSCANAASTTNAEQLVTAIPAWAQTVSTAASPVLVADLWTNSDAREADDCVHPNDAGARRMATNWFNALRTILR